MRPNHNACRKSRPVSEPIHQLNLPEPGSIISGHYRIVGRLGEGGMGSVFKAKDLALKRDVAIKFLLPHRLAKSVNVLRFQREAHATALLRHPGVVRIHSVETTEDGQPFLVMDFILGKTLAQRIASEGQLPIDEVLDIFIAVCDALAHAHSMGVLHRDLKPSNIIICSGGSAGASVKVLDFGLAKIIASASTQDLTQTGQTFGTPAYMSPEMALGNAVDHRSDIYSLGCTLYEALTASPPHVADTAYATVLKHETDKALTLSEAAFGRDFPEKLEMLVAKLIAKRPEQRYQSMKEVKEALLGLKGNLDTKQSTLHTTSKDTSLNYRTLMTAVVLAGIAGVVVPGVFLWSELMPPKTQEAKLATPQSIRQGFLDENQKSADDFVSLGDKCLARGNVYPAVMAYGAALTALGANVNRKSSKIAEVMNKKAQALFFLGRLAESEKFYRQSLAVTEEIAPNSDEHFYTMVNLGTVCIQEKKMVEAKQLIQSATDHFRVRRGTNSTGTALCLNTMATCYRENHEYSKAEDTLLEVSAIHRKLLGPYSDWYAKDQCDLAQNYNAMGNFAKAETAWNEAIKQYRAIAGRQMAIGSGYLELGHTQKAKGDLSAALNSIDQGTALMVNTPARTADILFDSMLSKVDILVKLKRYEEAEGVCQQTERYFSTELIDKPGQLAPRLVALAQRQKLLGRNHEAQVELKKAKDLFERAKSGDQIGADDSATDKIH